MICRTNRSLSQPNGTKFVASASDRELVESDVRPDGEKADVWLFWQREGVPPATRLRRLLARPSASTSGPPTAHSRSIDLHPRERTSSAHSHRVADSVSCIEPYYRRTGLPTEIAQTPPRRSDMSAAPDAARFAGTTRTRTRTVVSRAHAPLAAGGQPPSESGRTPAAAAAGTLAGRRVRQTANSAPTVNRRQKEETARAHAAKTTPLLGEEPCT